MRIGRASVGGQALLVEETDGGYVALGDHTTADLAALLRDGTDPRALARGDRIDIDRLEAPLRPGKIIAIGLNYLDHIRETGLERPQSPLVFAKFPSSVVGPTDAIAFDPAWTQRVDWEVELAVVIGRRLRSARPADVADAVFGYTAANDVSARDLQFGDGQWTRGKSLDTFCPLGPVVVTADEVADPGALRLRTMVNGEVMQDATTADMIFGIGELLSYCSQSFTLEPGDVLLTGTPWGCGEFMQPQRSLKDGDLVEVEVESIGRLANPVVATSDPGAP